MVDDAQPDAGGAFRGFLFCDMRGFTAFAERYGNTAAAAKVSRFLEIARKAIAGHEGAEIKTEGDAIHAVFPSAPSAVLCGLEIVDAAAELNAREPDSPLNLGVGIHAGEAVETPEGYIGSAVNVAARLCAVALPGEVLVSSTVKNITQASIPVGFITRGRQRLKGIREPVQMYAVTRDLTASASRSASNNVVLAAIVAGLAVIVAIAAVLTPQFLATAGGSPQPPPSTAQPVVVGELNVARYASTQFQPPVTFDIGDPGWAANGDDPDMLGLIREDSPRGSVYFLRVNEVVQSPCTDAGQGGQPRPATPDVIAELKALTHLSVEPPTPVQVGGYNGQQVEIAVSDGALAACAGLAGAEVSLFGVGNDTWRVSSGERFRLISVTVGNEPVTIVVSTDWTQTPSVQEMEKMFQLGRKVVDTVGF